MNLLQAGRDGRLPLRRSVEDPGSIRKPDEAVALDFAQDPRDLGARL